MWQRPLLRLHQCHLGTVESHRHRLLLSLRRPRGRIRLRADQSHRLLCLRRLGADRLPCRRTQTDIQRILHIHLLPILQHPVVHLPTTVPLRLGMGTLTPTQLTLRLTQVTMLPTRRTLITCTIRLTPTPTATLTPDMKRHPMRRQPGPPPRLPRVQVQLLQTLRQYRLPHLHPLLPPLPPRRRPRHQL